MISSPSFNNASLQKAVVNSDVHIDELENLLQQNQPIDWRHLKNDSSQTPLIVAVVENRIAALQLLLKYNADPDMQDRKGNTALHLATENG